MISGKSLTYQLRNSNTDSMEPAVKVGGYTATVAGVISVVLYFFPDIPDSVIQGILVVVAFALPLVTAAFTRGQVWSPASVQAVVDAAVNNALEQANKGKLDNSLGLRKATPDQDDNPYSGK